MISMKKLFFSLLLALAVSAAHAATSVTQNGITWTFSADCTVGQYVNGDYYVVAPVTISSVSPGWDGVKHGSMLDPVPLAAQGFDSRIHAYYPYSAANRVTFPLVIGSVTTPKSLLSAISLATNVTGGAYQALSDMAVLTIVASAPAANSFRPAYVSGGSKTQWNVSDVNYSLVPTLAVPSGATVPTGLTWGAKIYPYFGPQVWTTTIIPENNVKAGASYEGEVYPAYYTEYMSKMALAMMHTGASRTEYINRFIQQGIDLYEISLGNVDGWQANGGFGGGMKWPIIFAGKLLGSTSMRAMPLWLPNWGTGSNVYKVAEDGFTYIGATFSGYPSGRPRYGIDYVSMGLSLAGCTSNCMARDPDGVWNPSDNPSGFGGGYQFLTSNRWMGQALAVRLMDSISDWNHQAFFDYMDWWKATPADWNDGEQTGWGQYHQDVYGYGDGSGYVRLMWETYRAGGGEDDETAPTPNPATIASTSHTDTTITVTATTATDETALGSTPYEFSSNNGSSWTSGQALSTYTFSSLTPSTVYAIRVRYRDLAGNVTTQSAVSSVTTNVSSVSIPRSRNNINPLLILQ